MSYKLHNCGIPEKGQVNGIIKGVFEECVMKVEYNAVYISRGKIIVCGYEIEIDGREVVGISENWADELYLIGALTVENGKATEFKLSLRNSSALKKDDVLGKGYGRYEVLLATVKSLNGNYQIKREIEVLSDNVEFDKSEYKTCVSRGEILSMNDAKRGYLKNVAILGNSQGIAPNRLSCVPSNFVVKTQSANRFDYQGTRVLKEGENPSGKCVSGVKVTGEIQKFNNGFRALSWRETSGDFFANGYVEFFVGRLEKGDYFLTADVFVHEGWEGNDECTCFFQVFQDDLDMGLTMRRYNIGETVRGEANVVLTEDCDLKIRFYFSGLDITISNIQVEQGTAFTQYAPYFSSKTEINVLDKDGNAHKLYSINNCHDEIFFDEGKYKLIKRIKMGGHEVVDDMKDYSYYYDGGMLEIKYHEKDKNVVSSTEEGILIYPTKNPEIIELDQDSMSALKTIEVGPGNLCVWGEIAEDYDFAKPIISAEYYANPFGDIQNLKNEIESLKNRIKMIEG